MSDKTAAVYAIYDMGEKYDYKASEGHRLRLWGLDFECDGKGYKADIEAKQAKELIDNGRAKKA